MSSQGGHVGEQGRARIHGKPRAVALLQPLRDAGWPGSVVAAGLLALGHEVRGARIGEDPVGELERLKQGAMGVIDGTVLVLPRKAELADRWLRSVLPALSPPVIVVDPISNADREILALHGGAADYVGTPHDLLTLEARLRLHVASSGSRSASRSGVHRSHDVGSGMRPAVGMNQAGAPSRVLTFGPFEVDPLRRRATCRGRLLDLTPSELAILVALVQAQGAALSVAALADVTRSPERTHATDDVRTYVRRIRRKLRGDARLLETAHGGYRLGISR
jgi:DNA-binding response OmpR family regulator